MALKLPTLVYDEKTRISGEVITYYNIDSGKKIGSLIVGASGVEKLAQQSCGGAQECPSGGFPAAVIVVPNEAELTVEGAGAFPRRSPIHAALEIDAALSEDIDDYDLATGGQVGDQVDVWCLPDPVGDTLICFDQGLSAEAGERFRPIPRKLVAADHYVRQRPENSITLTDILVSQWNGLQRINGLSVTLIAKLMPDGGSVPSQINYYNNVRLNVPTLDNSGEANDSIEITGEGNFEEALIFAAQPT